MGMSDQSAHKIAFADCLPSGTAGLIWTTIIVWLFMLALIASMFVFCSSTVYGKYTNNFTSAEMASMAPNRYLPSLHGDNST